jgi:hypothetical protein
MSNTSESKNGTKRSDDQIERFRRKARELGCDEDAAGFRDKVRAIAQQKPAERPLRKRKK